jgi:hypothetical protein
MPERELEKLLGGFAADTLTAEERQQLYAAALRDQEIFNALADEQGLKDLLADPVVRRKLLGALAPHRDAGRWRSWLDRFTSPAGLAWAGGVAVGVFAVVLGLRVYEASLRQAVDTAAVEEERSMAPSTAPSAPPLQVPLEEEKHKEPKAAPKDDARGKITPPSSTLKSREQSASSRPRQEPEPSQEHAAQQQRESTKEAPAADAEVRIMAQAETVATAASARTLFYARASHPNIAAATQEVESVQKTDRLALAKKAPERGAPATPLALRYSLISAERQLSADIAVGGPKSVTLMVQSNQEGYVQVWKRTGDSLPELVLPAKETGRISLKTIAGEHQQLAVPGDTDLLIVRLSRVPFGPITRQEAVMAGHGSPTQLTESGLDAEEQATYVANPDNTVAELAIEIPIGSAAR